MTPILQFQQVKIICIAMHKEQMYKECIFDPEVPVKGMYFAEMHTRLIELNFNQAQTRPILEHLR